MEPELHSLNLHIILLSIGFFLAGAGFGLYGLIRAIDSAIDLYMRIRRYRKHGVWEY